MFEIVFNNSAFHTAASHTHKNKINFKLLPVHQIKFTNLEMCLKSECFFFQPNKMKTTFTNVFSPLFKKDLKADKGLP